MSSAQIVKWGNSLAIRIPKPIAQQAGVDEGDIIVLEAERGQIRLRCREEIPTLEELVSRITPKNRHGETLVGREIGNEVVEW